MAATQTAKISGDTWVKLALWTASGIAIGYGVKKVLDYIEPEKKRQESETKQIQSELETSQKKKPASYAPSTYAGWAAAIAEAIFGFGTYNDVIVNIFRQLKNDTDFLMLQKAWGNPKRQVYPDGFVFYSTGKKLELGAALREDMANSYIKLINKILANKGIKYRI